MDPSMSYKPHDDEAYNAVGTEITASLDDSASAITDLHTVEYEVGRNGLFPSLADVRLMVDDSQSSRKEDSPRFFPTSW